jgi:hypothetical protein
MHRLLQCVALCVRLLACSEAGAEPVFADASFQQGFLLSYPDPAQGRTVEAVLDLGRPDARPVWRLCQWATKYSLAEVVPALGPQGDVTYENEGKRVVVGGSDSPQRDLILEIRGRAEYRTHVRRAGEGWPHLLVEQDATGLYRLDALERLTLSAHLRLLYCTRHMVDAEYDPGRHAAQFQLFFIVKNVNPQAENYSDFYWFGVPFFDNRYDSPPAYMAKDAGKADALGIAPLKGGPWVAVDTDVLPHIKRGVQEAVVRGYLEDDALGDYAVVNMNMGWEIPGTFNAAVQVRGLQISAVPMASP